MKYSVSGSALWPAAAWEGIHKHPGCKPHLPSASPPLTPLFSFCHSLPPCSLCVFSSTSIPLPPRPPCPLYLPVTRGLWMIYRPLFRKARQRLARVFIFPRISSSYCNVNQHFLFSLLNCSTCTHTHTHTPHTHTLWFKLLHHWCQRSSKLWHYDNDFRHSSHHILHISLPVGSKWKSGFCSPLPANHFLSGVWTTSGTRQVHPDTLMGSKPCTSFLHDNWGDKKTYSPGVSLFNYICWVLKFTLFLRALKFPVHAAPLKPLQASYVCILKNSLDSYLENQFFKS